MYSQASGPFNICAYSFEALGKLPNVLELHFPHL